MPAAAFDVCVYNKLLVSTMCVYNALLVCTMCVYNTLLVSVKLQLFKVNLLLGS